MSRTVFAAFITLALTIPAAAQSNVPVPVQVSGQTSPWRISKLIGMTVYNPQYEKIGTVADLIMEPQGRITTAIISVGGYLGVGERLVKIPLEALRFPNNAATTGAAEGSPEKKWFPERAVLNATKDTLESMAPFQY